MPTKNSRKTLVKKLDKVFSEYIRRKWADHTGLVQCITCGGYYDFKKIQAGHYISRKYHGTRWDEENTRPQCWACNAKHMGNGRSDVFALYLISYYGKNILKKLNKKKINYGVYAPKYTTNDLLELISMYQGKIDNLRENLHGV